MDNAETLVPPGETTRFNVWPLAQIVMKSPDVAQFLQFLCLV